MNTAELLLHHAAVETRARALRGELDRLRERRDSNTELAAAIERLEAARARQREAAHAVRTTELEVAGHRDRMRERDRELMSGRIHNPGELTRLSAEVEHMKERIAAEEDAELELLERLEGADADLAEAEAGVERVRSAQEAAAPGIAERERAIEAELVAAEADLEATWGAVPEPARAAYRRVRVLPPVAEAVAGQCSACRVQVSSGGAQLLRRGEMVPCDNCGRLLVLG